MAASPERSQNCGLPRNLSCVATLLERWHLQEASGDAELFGAAQGSPYMVNGCASPPNLGNQAALGRPREFLLESPPNEGGRPPRRAKSLPPPSLRAAVGGWTTPNSRKRVRFADSLGLDLAVVRHYRHQDEPAVPQRVLAALRPPGADPWRGVKAGGKPSPPEAQLLQPEFEAQGRSADFLRKVSTQKVCLESIGQSAMGLRGVVRVLNLSFEKAVWVRHSADGWCSHSDIPARYLPGSSDGKTDQFAFELTCPASMRPGETLHFALRYYVGGLDFWDNNGGSNYIVRCHRLRLSPPSEIDDSWIHFI
uniref:protein phosphatase 1 regulatory subunit 3E-like n=1 Tax=Myxine glutinosa TaxID=7769 RepID=UPI00358EA318